jgi:adenosylcobinamide kinase/adenosylcobinamide-phosphate guanylyltransferase
MAKIILVTGGARSGKSAFAEKLVESYGRRVAYIATAEIWDREMAERVGLHRDRRPNEWTTYEVPLQAETAIAEAVVDSEAILFDCLTVYVSNCLLALQEDVGTHDRSVQVLASVEKLLEATRQFAGTVIFVTNEVGDGIVPENRLAREFRDLAGWVNQRVAKAADEVFLVVCGLPVEIKQRALFMPGGNP